MTTAKVMFDPFSNRLLQCPLRHLPSDAVVSRGSDHPAARCACRAPPEGPAVTFAEHPDQWQMLLDDRSRIPAAVEELLRWEAPAQYLVRYSIKDVELHGTTIPAGNPVLLCLGSANRDERAFADADTFESTGTAARHRTWG